MTVSLAIKLIEEEEIIKNYIERVIQIKSRGEAKQKY